MISFFRWTRRLLLLVLITGLLATNVLTLASATFHSMMYGLLSALPVERFIKDSPTARQKKLAVQNKQMTNRKSLAQKKAKATKTRIFNRSRNMLARNAAQIPAATLPIGIGLVIATTALDIKDACDTSREIDELILALDLEVNDEDSSAICSFPGAASTFDMLGMN